MVVHPVRNTTCKIVDCLFGIDSYENLLTKRKKGRDLTQSYDKSPYTSRNVKREKWQHKQCHKKFAYTAIADRLRTVGWSNYGHPNSFSMNIEKGYSFLKSLKPIDFFDLYIYKQSGSLLKKITMVRGFKANVHQGCNDFLPFNGVQCRAVAVVALLTFVSIPDMLRNPQVRIQNIFPGGRGPNGETSDLKV